MRLVRGKMKLMEEIALDEKMVDTTRLTVTKGARKLEIELNEWTRL